jgi:hypothetical protein
MNCPADCSRSVHFVKQTESSMIFRCKGQLVAEFVSVFEDEYAHDATIVILILHLIFAYLCSSARAYEALILSAV